MFMASDIGIWKTYTRPFHFFQSMIHPSSGPLTLFDFVKSSIQFFCGLPRFLFWCSINLNKMRFYIKLLYILGILILIFLVDRFALPIISCLHNSPYIYFIYEYTLYKIFYVFCFLFLEISSFHHMIKKLIVLQIFFPGNFSI